MQIKLNIFCLPDLSLHHTAQFLCCLGGHEAFVHALECHAWEVFSLDRQQPVLGAHESTGTSWCSDLEQVVHDECRHDTQIGEHHILVFQGATMPTIQPKDIYIFLIIGIFILLILAYQSTAHDNYLFFIFPLRRFDFKHFRKILIKLHC